MIEAILVKIYTNIYVWGNDFELFWNLSPTQKSCLIIFRIVTLS